MTCDETFERLARGELGPDEQRAVDAHLATCAECRSMKAGLAAYDEALAHPERFAKDPPHVKDAILRAARIKAEEYRRQAERDEERSLDARRLVLVAAAVLLLVGAGFVAGRLTAPPRTIFVPMEGPAVGIDSRARSTPR